MAIYLTMSASFTIGGVWLVRADIRDGSTGLNGFTGIERNQQPIAFWAIITLLTALTSAVAVCAVMTVLESNK
ncbi:hypothetical protein [Sphingomonas sp. UYP23]